MSDATLSLNAQPAQKVYLKPFLIDQLEVTFESFHRFKPKFKYETISLSEPIRGVSWYEADAYGLSHGKRLPTEVDWEKDPRGSDERLFVWGEQLRQDNAKCGNQCR